VADSPSYQNAAVHSDLAATIAARKRLTYAMRQVSQFRYLLHEAERELQDALASIAPECREKR
jgi:hypothetical protein